MFSKINSFLKIRTAQRWLPRGVLFLSVEVKNGNTKGHREFCLRLGVIPNTSFQILRLYDSLGLQKYWDNVRKKNLKPRAFMSFK